MSEHEFDLTIYELQAEISKTLAHPIRLAVLHCLKDGEKTVNDLVKTIGASQSNISQHLTVLRKAKIIDRRKEANFMFYTLKDNNVYKLLEILKNNFC